MVKEEEEEEERGTNSGPGRGKGWYLGSIDPIPSNLCSHHEIAAADIDSTANAAPTNTDIQYSRLY